VSSERILLDPNAELAVGEGEVRGTIPRVSLSHHTFQPADSPRYLTLSTRAAAGAVDWRTPVTSNSRPNDQNSGWID
jgi:hypothetical protein